MGQRATQRPCRLILTARVASGVKSSLLMLSYFWKSPWTPRLPCSAHILEESPLQPAFLAEHHLSSLVPVQAEYVTVLVAP